MAAIDTVFTALMLAMPGAAPVSTAKADPVQSEYRREVILDLGAEGAVRVIIERWNG